jgi:hypothetical protein
VQAYIVNWGVFGEDEIMVFERGTSMRCLRVSTLDWLQQDSKDCHLSIIQ